MYENENRNLNGNSSAERNIPETTVNWTTPNMNETQGNRNNGYNPSHEGNRGQGYDMYSQQPGNSGNGRHGGPKKGLWMKRAAGITAAAVLFGAVSGGVMTGVGYLGGMYGSAGAQAQPQPQIQQVAPAVTTQNGGQGATTVTAVTDVSGIVETVMPSIVAINDTMTVQQRDFFGMPQTYQAQSSGSGIIINQSDTELLIATNNHVVDGAQDLKVTFVDNNDVSAAVKGTDSASDLAIIAVQLKDIPSDTMSKIKVASLGDSDNIKVGQQVVAIGNALGYGQSVTVGYVSALDREITDGSGITRTFIQTDAAINPGNSGGALIDLNGNVIGINAAKTASTEVEGMGFAIPISKAQDIMSQLMNRKTMNPVAEEKRGYLGIQGTSVDEEAANSFGMPRGVYIYKILDDGAAAVSDLREKDIITKVDGQSVKTMPQLQELLACYELGEQIELTVQTQAGGQYEERTVSVTLKAMPEESSQNVLQ